MAGELRLELLGGLHITHDSATVRGFVSTKAQALLCYLAVTGRPHLRAALATLFWGEASEAKARKNLRDVLSNLRRLLEPHLTVTRDAVAFAHGAPYWLDVRQFQDEIKAASAGSLSADRQVERLWAALALYKGDLLHGFHVRDAAEFDEWARGLREQLRQQVLDALQLLADYHLSRDEHEQSMGALRRLLTIDPWAEGVHRQLMRQLMHRGQREVALQQYEVCRRTLEAELGLEPAAETIDLYEQIRAGRVLTRHPSAQLAPSRRHNLPAAPTSLLGRETELAHVDALMHAPDSRLVTICGPGGVGKTSLALQVARAALTRFQDGVWFVDLTALTDPALVSAAIARVLDIQESGNQGLGASLEAYLRDRQLLLVVDNFEHLLGAAPVIARLLAATTRLVVLATSRAPLHVRGEHELPLDPLAPPETTDLATVALSPAARLFVERAQAILPSFQLTPANAREIAEICAHLDGMPLAIELAAARVKLLPPHDLLLRLEQRVPGRLKVLAGGARDLPERHQTLRATLNWSYNLLSAYEQRLFRWLAVFGSSCTLAAVEAVCADMDASIDILEGVASLLDKSLIRQAPLPASGNRRSLTIEPRFSMFETIREYARELLERSGEAKVLHARHAEYYVRLAEQVEPALSGGPQQATLLRWLVEEHDNLRLAFTWAVQEQHVQIALRLTTALRRFWLIHGPISEGRTWLGLALVLQPS